MRERVSVREMESVRERERVRERESVRERERESVRERVREMGLSSSTYCYEPKSQTGRTLNLI